MPYEQSRCVAGSHTNILTLAFVAPAAYYLFAAGGVEAAAIGSFDDTVETFVDSPTVNDTVYGKPRRRPFVDAVDYPSLVQPVPYPTPTIPLEPTVTQPELPVENEMARPPIRKNRPVVKALARRKRVVSLNKAPVTMMTTAPVSIGNTVRGVEAKTTMLNDGCIVSGRDFMFSPVGSGTVQTWTLVGGAPLTPAAFADSTLRQYMQMFQRFRFRKFVAHYITSSPTSANGDVMFYYGKNRDSVFLNQTSGNLLPFVISDPNTVLGPQWQNHSAAFSCTGDWRSCDYGMESNPSLYADGELFLLSKTSTTDSPGYVMFDYIIEFSQKSISPRLLTLPITRILWAQFGLTFNNAAAVLNTPVIATLGVANLGGLASAYPIGITAGDVFKMIFDITNSTFVGGGSGAFITSNIPNQPTQTTSGLTLQDGTTVYGVFAGNGIWSFYTNSAAAYANERPLWYSATTAITGTNVQVWASFIGAITGINNTPNF